MFDNNKQKLQDANIECFDENDDVILPDTYWGEFLYIIFIALDIIKGPDRKTKFKHLQRQICIHKRWMKVKD
mgnify:CR=1 FL=1